MNRAIALTALAVILYALQNVLMEQRLAKHSTVSILVIAYTVMLPLSLIRLLHLRLAGNPVIFPTGSLLTVALLTGLLWFASDYCYVGAYTSGGDLVTITTVIALFPVAASVIRFFITAALPNAYQFGAWLLAAAAVYLVTRGAVSR